MDLGCETHQKGVMFALESAETAKSRGRSRALGKWRDVM